MLFWENNQQPCDKIEILLCDYFPVRQHPIISAYI